MIALDSLLDSIAEPQVSVRLMGIPLDAVPASCLLDVSVTATLASADHLTMRFATWDPDRDIATYVDDLMFSPGVKVAIAMGYGEALAPVFDGDIVGYELELSGGDRPVASISAYGALHRLGRGRRDPKDSPKGTYAAIVTDIAQRHRMLPRIEGSEAFQVNDNVKRHNETDQGLLTALAEEIGYEFFVDIGDQLVFRKKQPSAHTSAVITAAELLQFSGRIDAAGQLGRVKGSAYGLPEGQHLKAEAINPFSTDYLYSNAESVSAQQFSVLTQVQMQAFTDAGLLGIQESFATVDLTCFGRTDVKVGAFVALGGVSRRFDGPYTITNVTHTFSPGQGYRTRLSLKGGPR